MLKAAATADPAATLRSERARRDAETARKEAERRRAPAKAAARDAEAEAVDEVAGWFLGTGGTPTALYYLDRGFTCAKVAAAIRRLRTP